MGLMNAIKRIAENRKDKSEKFKQMEEDYMLEKKLMERQKSSNLREYEKYLRDKEEERVKLALDKIHKHQQKEFWKNKNSILESGNNILKDDNPILKQKNIFTNNKNIFAGDKGCFFKW